MSQILLMACAHTTTTKRIDTTQIIARPDARPQLRDNSIKNCPECEGKLNQIKMTQRDFITIKRKIDELDSYITYLLDVID